MVLGLCIFVIFVIMISTWFLGLWSNVITFVNTVLAAMVASNFFEPLADRIDNSSSSYTYLLDFVCLWLLFFMTFAVLRTTTDLLGRHRLQFNKWLDMTVRTVFSFGTAWVFVCFMLFTFHTAPLPVDSGSFQETPDTSNFAASPDRLWLGFLQSRSRGALASSIDGLLVPEYDLSKLHKDDKDLGSRVFDSKSDFIFKYQKRRQTLSEQETLRVQR